MAMAALGYILKAVKSSKGGQEASNEISTAIWEWVRPIFLKEDEDLVSELEKNPEDQDIQEELKLRLKRKAKNDHDFGSKLANMISQAQSNGEIGAKTIVQNNTYGDNVGGNKTTFN